MRISYTLFLLCLLTWQQTLASETLISFKEVQSHNIAKACWIVINATVYDITKFIKAHDTKCKYVKLTDLCGKDASAIWLDKQKSEHIHKHKSVLNLEQSKIGQLR